MEGRDVNEPDICEGAQMAPMKWRRWMKVEHRAFSMLADVGGGRDAETGAGRSGHCLTSSIKANKARDGQYPVNCKHNGN
jgi:hypothetical protein